MQTQDSTRHGVATRTVETGTLRPVAVDECVRPFLEGYLAHLPGVVGQMLALIEKGDFARLGQVVHGLKGTGGLYGLMPITEQATIADETIKRGDDPQQALEQVRALIALIRRVEGYDTSRERTEPR